jgi:hypothetical protein
MAASAMRKMQVPAYWPGVLGVHAMENNGVVVEEKNVIAIASIPIMLPVEDDISIELVEVGIDIPVMVLAGVPEVDVDMPFISIFATILIQMSLGRVVGASV